VISIDGFLKSSVAKIPHHDHRLMAMATHDGDRRRPTCIGPYYAPTNTAAAIDLTTYRLQSRAERPSASRRRQCRQTSLFGQRPAFLTHIRRRAAVISPSGTPALYVVARPHTGPRACIQSRPASDGCASSPR